MFINKRYIVLGFIIAFCLFFELAAHADVSNESTTITFQVPVQIPGQVLPAGTYIFEQADLGSDLHYVRIFNADHSALVAAMQTVPTQRASATGDTVLTLAEPADGKTPALVKWFYPNTLYGHEFIYPRQQERELSQQQHETFVNGQLVSGTASGE